MAEDGFTGEHLIMFGDGAAEIKATRNLGGLSIGVCSDEVVNGSGVVDQSKRDIHFQQVLTPSSLTPPRTRVAHSNRACPMKRSISPN